jgi:hypothetical protein
MRYIKKFVRFVESAPATKPAPSPTTAPTTEPATKPIRRERQVLLEETDRLLNKIHRLLKRLDQKMLLRTF